MSLFLGIDILDEHDALTEDQPQCTGCGGTHWIDASGLCAACRQHACLPECEICGEPVASVDDYGWCPGCRDNEDPSPMCNCGTCSAGNYTCIRKD